ncbi:hypothetical protein ACFV7R_29190 [Streptomyces sp. NPDC059866]|uniref:hypothetical protein n=1 Tax=Streptomyces sp. NPDC059866 TaxID=3346978 RepID=UPI003658753A
MATARAPAMDAVQRAGNGHPGAAMALAPVTYLRYQRIMCRDPSAHGRRGCMHHDRQPTSRPCAADWSPSGLPRSSQPCMSSQLRALGRNCQHDRAQADALRTHQPRCSRRRRQADRVPPR